MRSGRGHVWTGAQAQPIHLVDRFGGLEDAIDEAKRRIGLSPETKVQLYELPNTPPSLLGALGTWLGVSEAARTAAPRLGGISRWCVSCCAVCQRRSWSRPTSPRRDCHSRSPGTEPRLRGDLRSVRRLLRSRVIIAGLADVTDTFISDERRDPARARDWALIAALDCERLSAPPWSVSLAGADLVELGRGGARAAHPADRRLRIDVPDRRASQVHVRLVRDSDGEGWTIEDAGSKNGVRLNGELMEPAGRARLAAGDVLEVGGTFLVLRRVPADLRTHEGPTGRADGLATMSPDFARALAVLDKIARSRVPVLVRGESGTGKEVVARCGARAVRAARPARAGELRRDPGDLARGRAVRQQARRVLWRRGSHRPGAQRRARHPVPR